MRPLLPLCVLMVVVAWSPAPAFVSSQEAAELEVSPDAGRCGAGRQCRWPLSGVDGRHRFGAWLGLRRAARRCLRGRTKPLFAITARNFRDSA